MRDSLALFFISLATTLQLTLMLSSVQFKAVKLFSVFSVQKL